MSDQNDDLENDVDSTDASGDLAANSMPPAMSSSMKMPQAPMNPVLQQYLQNKSQMADAQKQAANNEMYTGLARAGASLSAGLARSSQPVDQKPFDAMATADQAPVTNIQTAQKSQAQDLANQSGILETEKKIGDSDPNSPQSVAYKEQIKRLYPGKFDDATLATLSKADIGDSIMKPLELDEKIQARKEEMQQRGLDRSVASSSKKAEKEDAVHEKYVQHVEDNEKNWRSDPASTRYDSMIGAATTGKAMIDRYRGREDEMPIQDIHALVSDRLKAITGATPTEAEIDAQMPHTLKTKFGSVKSWVTGSPEPANAGDFVRNIDASFREMEKTAQAGLKHRQESVASSPRLTPEERSRLTKIGVPDQAYGQAPSDDSASAQDHASRAAAILAKRSAAKAAGENYAYGGVVQAPGFQHIHQATAPHIPKPAPLPKMPVAHAPPGMKPMATSETFAQGGEVPGSPQFQRNDPRNDVVAANLTPKEIVLPLSVTQSKDPAMAAYLYTKHVLGHK